jgi:hypothetical protein
VGVSVGVGVKVFLHLPATSDSKTSTFFDILKENTTD